MISAISYYGCPLFKIVLCFQFLAFNNYNLPKKFVLVVRIVQFVKIVQLVQLDYYGYIKFFGVFVGTWVGAFTSLLDLLKKYIQLDMYNLKSLVTRLIAGESVFVNPDKFQNDMTTLESSDDVLTLLVHLGYLTYDFDNKKVAISNQEVQIGLQQWSSSQGIMLINRQ